MSRDYRSAGLRWSLPLSGGSFGCICCVVCCISAVLNFGWMGIKELQPWRTVLVSWGRQWTVYFISCCIWMSLAFVFSIISLFPADAAADRFVMKSTVTSGQREGPAFFSSFVVSVGADLGGHGRLPGLFGSCLIFSITCCFSWCRRRSFHDGVYRDQWTKGRTSFLFIICCFSWCCHRPFFLENIYHDY